MPDTDANTQARGERCHLSIVIPCFDAAGVVGYQLRAISSQLIPGDEVIVVDNRSNDDLAGAINRVRGLFDGDALRVVPANGRQGINHARNAGVRAAQHEAIVLCDADDLVCTEWLTSFRAYFAQGAQALGGPLLRVTQLGQVLDEVRGVYSYFWPKAGVYVSTATGANCAFTRTAYENVNGFDEDLAGGSDEIDFFYRLSLRGVAVQWVPTARVRYVQRQGWKQVWRQQRSYGEGAVRLHRKLTNAGMPRDAWWMPTAALAVGTLQWAAGRPAQRRQGLERVARRYGRLIGSLKQRHIYL